jgi:alkylation response protein AidB-like acyl-CoA dehydrogenase
MNLSWRAGRELISVCVDGRAGASPPRDSRVCRARDCAQRHGLGRGQRVPHGVVKKLGAMGLLGVIFPPEYGGAGLGYVDYVLAIEELSAVDGSIGHHRRRA